MTTTSKPPKHLVREYLERRTHEAEPPPTPEDIRRQLGWRIVEAEREAREHGSTE